MDKKKKINVYSQTESQEIYFVDPEQKATQATEELFTKDDFLAVFDKDILTDMKEEKSAKGKKKNIGLTSVAVVVSEFVTQPH